MRTLDKCRRDVGGEIRTLAAIGSWLEFEEILPDGNGVLFLGEEFDDFSSLRGIHSYIDL
jgi:hypothetical protein